MRYQELTLYSIILFSGIDYQFENDPGLLHLACLLRNTEAAHLLIQKGVSVKMKDRNGKFYYLLFNLPGCVAQSVGHLTRKSGVLGSIPGLATYFRFSFRFFKKGSCQLLAKVCAQSTG